MRNIHIDSKAHHTHFHRQPVIELLLAIQRTKWLFFALCCYLFSQSFTVPLLIVGPSWATWPTLPDLVLCLFIIILFLNHRSTTAASKPGTNILYLLIFLFLGCIVSYAIYFISQEYGADIGDSMGAFYIYRLTEFVIIYWITIRIPLTPKRIRVLSHTISIALLLTCTGIILTYFSIVPTYVFGAHLPQDFDVAGPWGYYLQAKGAGGLGTIGYNHGYVALQVIMLIGLRIHLNLGRKAFYNNILLILAIIACLLSESRAGMGTVILFSMVFWYYSSFFGLVLFLCGVTIGSVIFITVTFGDVNPSLEVTIERQLTLTDSRDDSNLSGRDLIWEEHIKFLNEEPIRWLIGTGFGSIGASNNKDTRNDAHMLYLHIISETGLIGLLLFLVICYKVLHYLYWYESEMKPFFWLTVALLFSSLTQETFYPVPAFGHFTGFYLCSLAIVLRSHDCEEVQLSKLLSERGGVPT